jgi:dTDP-4-dehydrorhamnose reductase
MRILITGAAGNLGGRLCDILQEQHEVFGADIVEGKDIDSLDITDFGAVRTLAADKQPDIILHPAAWTDVDGCARQPEKALAINGYGAQNVALAAAEIGAAILFISSNEVFDGKNTTPYLEYDETGAVDQYGYSKLVGERAVAAVNPKHYIVRTAWLFAHGGKNFIQSILNAAEQGKTLRVVTDEVANPTYNNDLADAIAKLIETGRYGTYHFVNEGACSRYHFARYALDKAGYTNTPIEPISSKEWPRKSVPPTYAALSNAAGEMVGITLRPWQEAVDAFLEKKDLLKHDR